MNLYLKIICLMFIFSSCEKELDLDIPALPQKVVVNSLFCPDSMMKIHISLTTGIKEETINFVENATLYLFEDGILIKTITNQENGFYNSFYKPKAGKKYRIEVEVPNFEKVWAESFIPHLPDSLSGIYYRDEIQTDLEFLTTSVQISFLDDEKTKNYYEPCFNPFRYQESRQLDQSILTESDLDFEPLTFYFSDKIFNGTYKKLILYSVGKGVFSSNGVIFFDEYYLQNFKIVSEEYFNFRKSWTKHIFNQNSDLHYNDPLTLLFLGDPIEMYTNVNGGFGVFAAYNQTDLKIYYQE
jgi:hypothetical protein